MRGFPVLRLDRRGYYMFPIANYVYVPRVARVFLIDSLTRILKVCDPLYSQQQYRNSLYVLLLNFLLP